MILNINKPANISSSDVVQIIKKFGKFHKVGHAGTLDPTATGVLIIGVDESTKELAKLILEDKEYIFSVFFGLSTETYDLSGKILKYNTKKISLKNLKKAISEFPKKYDQYPPIYSAIKVKGKKLCDYARSNEFVEVKARSVKIKNIKLLSYKQNIALIKINVSKGFYIRSFAMDLAKKLNTNGTIIYLTRTRSGNYCLKESINMFKYFNIDFSQIRIKKYDKNL